MKQLAGSHAKRCAEKEKESFGAENETIIVMVRVV